MQSMARRKTNVFADDKGTASESAAFGRVISQSDARPMRGTKNKIFSKDKARRRLAQSPNVQVRIEAHSARRVRSRRKLSSGPPCEKWYGNVILLPASVEYIITSSSGCLVYTIVMV